MRKSITLWLTLIMLFGCSVATLAKPMDLRAVKPLKTLADIIKQPLAERHVPEADIPYFIDLAKEKEGLDSQLIAALALAWAKDSESLEVLQKLAKERYLYTARGAATYALVVRANRDKSPDEFKKVLSDQLMQCKEPSEPTRSVPWEPSARMFLANRLAVDFGKEALPVIIAAINVETGRTARCDMLYYISELCDASTAREILSWQWEYKHSLIPEGLSPVLTGITPGRQDGIYCGDTRCLLKKLREKAAE